MKKIGIEVNGVLRDTIEKFKQVYEKHLLDSTEFEFVDQTEGNITQRYWVFGGVVYYKGERIESGSINITDPNVHTIKVLYESPSEYETSLIVIFNDQNQKNTGLKNTILVQ